MTIMVADLEMVDSYPKEKFQEVRFLHMEMLDIYVEFSIPGGGCIFIKHEHILDMSTRVDKDSL